MFPAVKPVAAYLAATDHFAFGPMALVVGELLKFVLVERLFSVSREKLMSIPAFAWTYWKYRLARSWLEINTGLANHAGFEPRRSARDPSLCFGMESFSEEAPLILKSRQSTGNFTSHCAKADSPRNLVQ